MKLEQSSRVLTVPLSKVQERWDVRVVSGEADEERVELFMGLYDDGVKLPPIDVLPADINGIYVMTDGRTRYAAKRKRGDETVEVRILEFAGEPEAIVHGYGANLGSKPPTFADLKKVVLMLTQRGQTRAQILKALSPVETRARLLRATEQVRSNIRKQRLADARKLTYGKYSHLPIDAALEKAAQEAQLPLKELRRCLLREDPQGRGRSLLTSQSKDFSRVMTGQRQWLARFVAKRGDELLTGESPEEVLEVFDFVLLKLKNNFEYLQQEKARFEKTAGKQLAATA